ncbi:MAG: hypothetical protein FWF43_05955 [Propionibacteriaceae bacterium]|nr:hypothetical protein [Propionibacteriaceae bacterium]
MPAPETSDQLPDNRSDRELLSLARKGVRWAAVELWRRHSAYGLAVAHGLAPEDDYEAMSTRAWTHILDPTNADEVADGLRPHLYLVIRAVASVEEEPDKSDGFLAESFMSLPDDSRQLLWYSHIESMNPTQIAVFVDEPVQSIPGLLHQARQDLRWEWADRHALATAPGTLCRRVWQSSADDGPTLSSIPDRHRLDFHLRTCRTCKFAQSDLIEVASHLRSFVLPRYAGSAGGSFLLDYLRTNGPCVRAMTLLPPPVAALFPVESRGRTSAPQPLPGAAPTDTPRSFRDTGRAKTDTTPTFPYRPRAVPDTSRAFPDTSRAFPDLTRDFPDVSRAFPDLTRDFPDTSRLFPGTPQDFPDTSRAFPDTPRDFPDTSRAFPGTPRTASGTPRATPTTPRVAPGTSRTAQGTPRPAPGTSRPASDAAQAFPDVPRAFPETTRKAPDTPRKPPGTPRARPSTPRKPAETTTACPDVSRPLSAASRPFPEAPRAYPDTRDQEPAAPVDLFDTEAEDKPKPRRHRSLIPALIGIVIIVALVAGGISLSRLWTSSGSGGTSPTGQGSAGGSSGDPSGPNSGTTQITVVDTGALNNLFPIVTGTTHPQSTVFVQVGGTELTVTAGTDGSWTSAGLTTDFTSLRGLVTATTDQDQAPAVAVYEISEPPAVTVSVLGTRAFFTVTGLPTAGVDIMVDGTVGGSVTLDASGSSTQDLDLASGTHFVQVRYAEHDHVGPSTSAITIAIP